MYRGAEYRPDVCNGMTALVPPESEPMIHYGESVYTTTCRLSSPGGYHGCENWPYKLTEILGGWPGKPGDIYNWNENGNGAVNEDGHTPANHRLSAGGGGHIGTHRYNDSAGNVDHINTGGIDFYLDIQARDDYTQHRLRLSTKKCPITQSVLSDRAMGAIEVILF